MTSKPIDLSLISRRRLRAAMEHVRTRGGRAVGMDMIGFDELFGTGPTSAAYRRTEIEIRKGLGAFRFGDPRVVEVIDARSEKVRVLEIPSIVDRIVLRALTEDARRALPPSSVQVCVSDLDSRFGVVRAALELRNYPGRVCLRSDLRAAFPSLEYQKLLSSSLGELIPLHLRRALMDTFRWFSPSGRGVPLGLPPSGFLMDLACSAFDERLSKIGRWACRYVDDMLIVADTPAVWRSFVALVEGELGPFGLQLNAEKTRLHSESADDESLCTIRPFPVSFCGFLISECGMIELPQGIPSTATSPYYRVANMAPETSSFESARTARAEIRLRTLTQGGEPRTRTGNRSYGSVPRRTHEGHPHHAPEDPESFAGSSTTDD